MKRAMPPALRSGACWPARSPGRKKRLLPEFWLAVQAQGAPLLEESRRRKARSPRCAACRARMSGHLPLPLPRGLRMACQLVIDPVQWPASGPHTRLQQVLAAGLNVQLDPLNPRAWHAGSANPPPRPDAAMPHLLACPFAYPLSAAVLRCAAPQRNKSKFRAPKIAFLVDSTLTSCY